MMQRRRIAYVSGTRADFGLMESTLRAIDAAPELELAIVVTGMHLDPAYGYTVDEIVATGLDVSQRIEIEQGVPSGALMAKNIGRMVVGFTEAFEQLRPDVVLVLGDRGEMLAAAVAALHLQIPICHIHGGERSGTVDEPVRHAVSKLANFHFVATEESRDRLIRMGEAQDHVILTGAPGLDGLQDMAGDAPAVLAKYGLDPALPFAILLYHPVVQEAEAAIASTDMLLDALAAIDLQVLALKPNSDAGSAGILDRLEHGAARGAVHLVTHLPRRDYVTLLKAAVLLIGNSSSGIIEAATFGTPVVNIGSRQDMRQRSGNVFDAQTSGESIAQALAAALAAGRRSTRNVYGDGHAGARIVDALVKLPFDASEAAKINAY